MKSDDHPKVKSQAFDLKKIATVRTKILDDVCYEYYGLLLVGELFMQFVADLHREVCPAGDLAAFVNTARSLAGRELTSEAAEEFAWRVAGNLHRLRRGLPVPPWDGQVEPEWVPMEIVSVLKRRRVFKAKKPEHAAKAGEDGLVRQRGVRIVARVLAGLSAGVYYRRFWSNEYCELVKRALGFDRWDRAKYSRVVSRRHARPYSDPRQFFGMRLYGLVRPELCRPGELYCDPLKATAPGVAHNRALTSLRLREGYDCPLGYELDVVECHLCHAGVQSCKAACHPFDFVQGACPRCKNEPVWLDPEAGQETCVDCDETSD